MLNTILLLVTIKMETKNNKKGILIAFLTAIVAIATILWILLPIFGKQNTKALEDFSQDSNKIDTNFIKAALPDSDTAIRIIRVSDSKDLEIPYTIDDSAGKRIKRVFDGRRINICVIGVDSRLGSSYKHADANHVLSIIVDKGIIELTSIPRDTYADCGFEENDTLDLNRLTNVYPARGREAYFKEVANIAGLDKIHHYIELGFSQAMGVLEFLGYKQSGDALQVLRSRQVLGGDDYQRSYNQGQFIRQTILRHFSKVTGFFSELVIRGGLAMVNTDINYERAKYIIDQLDRFKISSKPENIVVRVRPAIPINFKIYDFSDPETMTAIISKLNAYSDKHKDKSSSERQDLRAEGILNKAIERAILDTAKNPTRVIHTLKTYFDQRAWFQVQNQHERNRIRTEICTMLSNAYFKKNDIRMYENVKKVIELEKKLFSGNTFINSVSSSSSSSTNNDKEEQ